MKKLQRQGILLGLAAVLLFGCICPVFSWFPIKPKLTPTPTPAGGGPIGPVQTPGTPTGEDIIAVLEQNMIDVWTYIGKYFPSEYIPGTDIPTGAGAVDFSQVLGILDHLKVEDGYEILYYYRQDGFGAYPHIFAKRTIDPLYPTLEEYMRAVPGCISGLRQPGCDYLEHVIVDGTELGYLQKVLLEIIGDQFYLEWHANYNDTKPILTKEARDEVIKDLRTTDFGNPISLVDSLRAKLIDVRPRADIEEDGARVTLVTFTKWGGFFRHTYFVHDGAGYGIINEATENLLRYESGVMF